MVLSSSLPPRVTHPDADPMASGLVLDSEAEPVFVGRCLHLLGSSKQVLSYNRLENTILIRS